MTDEIAEWHRMFREERMSGRCLGHVYYQGDDITEMLLEARELCERDEWTRAGRVFAARLGGVAMLAPDWVDENIDLLNALPSPTDAQVKAFRRGVLQHTNAS
jgi:hypothetical protein